MLQSQLCNVSSIQFFRLVGSFYFPPGSCLSNNKIKPPCCVSDSPRVFLYLLTWCLCRSLALALYWSSSSWVITVGQTPTTPERVLTSLSFTHTHTHTHTHMSVQRNSKTLLQTSGNLLLVNRAEDEGQLLSPCQDESHLSLIHKS